jgi:hypothetical protein
MSKRAVVLILACWAGIALADGGETLESATPIPSLPYQDTGVTCGRVDDYDAACPYPGSSAPDVVYAFTPQSNMFATLDLCMSAYDTKLYVYANDTAHLVACNDDGCGEDWTSQIDELPLLAGTTYYIVVDGYGSSCGGYGLSVISVQPCTVQCPGGAQQEGEAPCHDDYLDGYDGGCDGSGWVVVAAQQSGCADVCGTACTYTVNGEYTNDTDWYALSAAGGEVAANVEAEFPIGISLWHETDCANHQYVSAEGWQPCHETSVSWSFAEPTPFWIRVTPLSLDTPEGDYHLHVCGLAEQPVPTVPLSWGRIKSRYR